MEKVKLVKMLSLFTSLRLISRLFFILWKSIEHDQPLLHLSISFLFPISLVIFTLLYFLNLFILGWILLQAKLTVDLITVFSLVLWLATTVTFKNTATCPRFIGHYWEHSKLNGTGG